MSNSLLNHPGVIPLWSRVLRRLVVDGARMQAALIMLDVAAFNRYAESYHRGLEVVIAAGEAQTIEEADQYVADFATANMREHVDRILRIAQMKWEATSG